MQNGVPLLDTARDHEQVERAIDASAPADEHQAYRSLQEAVRLMIVTMASGEISSKTLSQLQRFCASAGQAMVTLESPDALVRNRFSKKTMLDDGMDEEDAVYPSFPLATAPVSETYGANTSRGLIESAAKVAKDIVVAQAEAQRSARAPTLSEMVTSFVMAKNAKLPRNVLQAIEKQISASASALSADASPQAIDPSFMIEPKKKARGRR